VRKPVASAIALIALSLVAVLPAAAETYLLGGVLAAEVVDDEDTGLVNINGIHSAVTDVKVPYVADLVVYLRWEGEGEHDLAIEVFDPSDEMVTELSDTLDFQEYATNFTTHNLANTVFADEGVYTVVIYVDDEESLDLPFYVNVDEEDGSDEPFLLMSVPAIDGGVGDDGTAEVYGAFEHYTFKKLPAADDFAIVTLWFSGSNSYDQYVEIKDPKGAVVAKSDSQEVEAWSGELTAITDYFENFLFKTAGDYLVTVYLGDTEQVIYTLRVNLSK
jgi:hypothetical protein